MPEPRRVVTAPLSVRRDVGFSELATVVAADALVRRGWATGRQAELVVPVIGGDLAGQFAFDRELAREGLDRASVADDEYAARAAAFDDRRRLAVAEVLRDLNVAADLGAHTTTADEVATAARTAFVKLYEEGQVEQAERVVDVCPHCRSVVDAGGTVTGDADAELVSLRLSTAGGRELDVRLAAPELVPGIVAFGVAEGSDLVGDTVAVPVAGRDVPVLAVAGVDGADAIALVPAHDAAASATASAAGLAPVPVLGVDGAVVAEGPLLGLGRYAARAAARELLSAEGVVVSVEEVTEAVARCACCGTAVIPQLGRHWFLRSGDLEVAAADIVRHGAVEFSPAEARDAFLTAAGVRRDWCLSTDVTGGVALPAATCLDCGKLTVDVALSSSCGKCMGALAPEHEVLDAHFVAAVWSLVLAGWPARRGVAAEDAMAVVADADLATWILPCLALGIRLAGDVPFCAVVVHPPAATASSLDAEGALAGGEDRRVVRLALVAAADDFDTARAAVAALDEPVAAPADDDGSGDGGAGSAAAEGVAALDAGAPAQAAGLLAAALATGVAENEADRLRALALPILGD